MENEKLWETFKETGRIADYLRYRGVDIYAAQNAVTKEGDPDATKSQQTTPRHHPGSHHSGI
jgi:hypothetical protein